MLNSLTSISNTNFGFLLSIIIGGIISITSYFLSIFIHEVGHWIVTIYYCKSLNYSCRIRLLGISKDFKPHTESDYYTYLELNKSDTKIQYIIRNIAIAGYISSFTWLILFLFVTTIYFLIFKLKYLLFAALFILPFICFDVLSYLHSTDRQTLKTPNNFIYIYKQSFSSD